MEDGLNDAQRIFCELLLIGHSGARSYRKAYHTDEIESRQAAANAIKLKKNPKVAAYLQRRREEDQEILAFERSDCLRFLMEQVAEATAALDEEEPKIAIEKQKIGLSAMEKIIKMQGYNAPEEHSHTIKEMSEEELQEGLKRVGFGRRSNQLMDKLTK
jgi:phage terminase small subunit